MTGPGSPKCFGGACAGDLTSVTCHTLDLYNNVEQEHQDHNDPHGKPETSRNTVLWIVGVWSGGSIAENSVLNDNPRVENLGKRARSSLSLNTTILYNTNFVLAPMCQHHVHAHST